VDIEQRNAMMTALFLRHRSALYGYIFACVRNHNDAEDIFQEVSLAAVDSIGKLRDESGFLPWAIEIARRRVLVHIRRSQRTTILPPELTDLLAEATQRVATHGNLKERTEALLDCLEQLPTQSRTIITMRYDGSIGGVDELADKLGRTMQATYGVLKRIRRGLRDCVERKLGTETSP
jgi:RNA polymerase sigma-70 factor (ECF subfamily)